MCSIQHKASDRTCNIQQLYATCNIQHPFLTANAAYNALLALGVKQRNTALIGGVYKEMEAHDVPTSAETYQYMISAACADDDSTCAMIFFHEMRSKGFKPTTATVNELIIVNAER